MENYEQKYKEALSRARVVNPGTKDYNIVTAIFPELKESEDERIRKEIICYLDKEITLSNFGGDIATFKRWIAWLEKQGEHEASKEENIDNTNKIEPKFKVGDWIVGNSIHTINKIVNVKQLGDGTYGYDLNNGTYFTGFEEDYHLWTIQDSENGDVLTNDNDIIILVKESRNSPWGYRLSYHCAVLHDGTFEYREFHVQPEKFFPANEKQRNFLFQKMKEAGYKWDATIKELKKV